jgi:hypothetical protein
MLLLAVAYTASRPPEVQKPLFDTATTEKSEPFASCEDGASNFNTPERKGSLGGSEDAFLNSISVIP